jgi:hypothetical protein
MNSPRTTRLLLVLLAVSAFACIVSVSRARAMRGSARSAQNDLLYVQHELASVEPAAVSSTTAGSPDAADINRLVRQAADSAGALDALAGLEPGRLNDAGEIPVIVGFTPLTMKQLITFIHALASGPAPVRAHAVELSAADVAGDAERWTATITITVRSSR